MNVIHGVIAGCAALLVPALAVSQTASTGSGQAYPTKPIRVIVAVPAGGTPDVLARTVAPGMAALLGQQLVLDNRGGAGGRIAAEMVATATPDGYTVFRIAFSPGRLFGLKFAVALDAGVQIF